MADQFTTVSDQAADKHHLELNPPREGTLTKAALLYGAVAGVLMSIFIGVSGFYIYGDNAGFGFLNLLILGAAIYLLLVRTKDKTPAGTSVKHGILTSLTAGVSAGVVTAAASVFLNGRNTLESGVDNVADKAGNQFVMGGISFFLCLVASIIFSLIFMQLLKDDRPAR